MDVILRAPAIDSERTRLPACIASAAPERVRIGEVGLLTATMAAERTDLAVLRAEIEQSVRADLDGQARTCAEAMREKARSEGYETGLSMAREAARQELQAAIEAERREAQGALKALRQAQREALDRLQKEVGEIAFAAVCRIAGAAGSTESFVLGVVREVVARVRNERVVTVRLHPRDARRLQDASAADQSLASIVLNLVADGGVDAGGCIVETSSGHYDATLATQLARLHAVLTDEPAEPVA